MGTCPKSCASPGHAMAQGVSRWHCTPEAQLWSKASPCQICGGESGTRTGFSLSALLLPLLLSFHQCSILIYLQTYIILPVIASLTNTLFSHPSSCSHSCLWPHTKLTLRKDRQCTCNITLYLCITTVAMETQHAFRVFSTSHKWHDFQKILFKVKCVSWFFSTTFVKTFLIL